MMIMNDFKQELLTAATKDDQAALEAVGWQVVDDYLRTLTKQQWQIGDLEPFADLWHDRAPDAVISAARECMRAGASNGWRPMAGQLAPYFATGPASKRDATPPWQEPAALDTVGRLLASGEAICCCTPSSTALHLSTGLFRCPACGGLDAGQVEDALAVAA